MKLTSSGEPAPVQLGMLGEPDRTVTAESPKVLQGNLDELLKRTEWEKTMATAEDNEEEA